MISVLWAYEGWQYATCSAGETINPQRNFPLAFLVGSAAAHRNLSFRKSRLSCRSRHRWRCWLDSYSRIRAQCSHRTWRCQTRRRRNFNFHAERCNSIILNAPRVYYAMAKDGLFFKAFRKSIPNLALRPLAVIAAGIWSSILAASGTFEQLLTYVVFIGWIFYALAAASIFVYRKRFPNEERPYRVPGYPLTPLVFILAAAALVINTIASQPGRALVGLESFLLGLRLCLLAVYRKTRRAARPRARLRSKLQRKKFVTGSLMKIESIACVKFACN